MLSTITYSINEVWAKFISCIYSDHGSVMSTLHLLGCYNNAPSSLIMLHVKVQLKKSAGQIQQRCKEY